MLGKKSRSVSQVLRIRFTSGTGLSGKGEGERELGREGCNERVREGEVIGREGIEVVAVS